VKNFKKRMWALIPPMSTPKLENVKKDEEKRKAGE